VCRQIRIPGEALRAVNYGRLTGGALKNWFLNYLNCSDETNEKSEDEEKAGSMRKRGGFQRGMNGEGMN